MKKPKLILKSYYKICGIEWKNLKKKIDGINLCLVYYQKMNYLSKKFINIYLKINKQ